MGGLIVPEAGEALGIDVGGVIISRENDDTDTSFFGPNFLQTTAEPGAFETIGRLSMERFWPEVYLVSKCGRRVEERTKEWLRHHNFLERTNIFGGEEHFNFVRNRKGKAGVCRELGITHFIDDRLEVLSYLVGIVPHLYLFKPDPEEVLRYGHFLDKVVRVHSWDEVAAVLL
jgi:hypothetical protein